MKANYQVTNTKSFVLTNVNGKIDLNAGMNIFAGVMSLLKSGNQNRVLIDGRHSKTFFTLPDICHFLEQLSVYNDLPKNKIAVILPKQFDNDLARFFEVTAEGRGLKIKLFFDNFEAAVKWLMNKNSHPEYYHYLKN